MPAQLYKDIGKKAADILNDDYDFTRKLKVKTKTSNGVTFTTEGSMGANKSILAKLGANFDHSCGISVSKLQVTTQGRLIGEAEIANVLVNNLKLGFKLEDGSNKGTSKQVGSVEAKYIQNNFSFHSLVDIAGRNVTNAGVFHYGNVVFGGHTGFSLEKKKKVSDYGGAIGYKGSDFEATFMTKKFCKNYIASFSHAAGKNLTYSAVFDYDSKTAANILTIGGRYAADADTTYLSKIDSEGIISLGCIQKLRPFVLLTTSAQIDAKNFDGDAHKFGFGITLG
jgi:voltage-dependent anion channel protein 2